TNYLLFFPGIAGNYLRVTLDHFALEPCETRQACLCRPPLHVRAGYASRLFPAWACSTNSQWPHGTDRLDTPIRPQSEKNNA
ncbi:hypothetical protein OAF37_03130, partial [Rubripirellula sp.]